MENKLKNFLLNDNCYLIHYACDGFYTGYGSAPRVYGIVVNDFKENRLKEVYLDHFSKNDLHFAEIETLKNFAEFIGKKPYLIHWNMNSDGFGFKALYARCRELGIEIEELNEENKFDLASYVEFIAGKKLSIKQILMMNYCLYENFLDGKKEVEAFNNRNYNAVIKSLEDKVLGLSDVVDNILNNKLKTEFPTRPDDGLTKEERRDLALKIAESRERMISDIEEHNRKVLEHNERVMEKSDAPTQEEGLLFYDSKHPIMSLFVNWFVNK